MPWLVRVSVLRQMAVCNLRIVHRLCFQTRELSARSPITRQLPPSPMMVLAIGIENPLLVAIQRLEHADARMHHRPATLRRHEQDAGRHLPCAYRKSNPDIFVMQSAEDGAAKNTPCPLYGAR